jgi:peptidoglycan/LPS O-acetylase OafA/YrhL
MVSAAIADVRAADQPVRTGSSRRRDIQGLRAVAVILVVAFHAQLPISGGFIGVDVFFVISGFVITAMLHRELLADRRVHLPRFYLRRFMRLTPALAAMVSIVALIAVVLQSPFGPQQTVATTGLGSMLLSANFVIAGAAGDYFAAASITNPLLNTWSLSVEEQFYLFFPTLLAIGWLLGRRRRRRTLVPLAIILAVSLVSFAISLMWTFGSEIASGLTGLFGGPEVFAFYGPFSRVWEFGIGAALALIVARGIAMPRFIAITAGLGGAALVIASALLITEASPFPGVIAIVPVVGTALLLAAGTYPGSPANRVLGLRPMVAVGDISYSWYLWHWPIIVFTGVLIPGEPIALVIAAVASLLPAWLSYRFLEQPIRNRRGRSRARTVLVIAVTTLTPIALCLALLWGANTGWGGRFATPESAASTGVSATSARDGGAIAGDGGFETGPDPVTLITGDGAISADTTTGDLRSQHVAVKAGCVNTDIDPVACRFGPTDAKGTVLMLGDSQGYALADGLINAASTLGYATVVSSRTGCPFLGIPASGSNDQPCRPWQKAALKYALSSKPDAVVIANRSAGYVHPEWNWRTAATPDGGSATSVTEAAALWQQGIEEVVAPLRAAGIPVLIIAAVPEMPTFSDQRSLFSQTFGSKPYEKKTEQAISDRAPALQGEQAVASGHPGTFIYDPIPVLCSADTCLSAVDGVMRYQDETHLTLDGSLLLAPGLEAVLAKALSYEVQSRIPSSG